MVSWWGRRGRCCSSGTFCGGGSWRGGLPGFGADAAIRDSVVGALSDAGYTVHGLPDGSRLEAELERFRPGVVIVDWMLPGRDGAHPGAGRAGPQPGPGDAADRP